MKSWSKNNRVNIRNPKSTRPWQHVLEAVGGYLIFDTKLNKNKKLHCEAFNFGPNTKKSYNVISLVKSMKKYWKKVLWKISKQNNTILLSPSSASYDQYLNFEKRGDEFKKLSKLYARKYF